MTAHPLAPSLDTAAAAPLRLYLLGLIERHKPLVLDGSGVTRAGQACLQVLACAREEARTDGLAFRIENPSDALAGMAALAGLATVLDRLD